jgi:hypothetical protein
MRSFYPTVKKIFFLAIVLAIALATDAQEKKYAKNATQNTSSIPNNKPGAADRVIKVKGRLENKVGLMWAPFIGDVSHYVLERSTDGKKFNEIALFFTGDSGEETMYHYTDKLRRSYGGALYYRLRVEGLDGTVILTPVTSLNAVRF